VNWRWLTLLGGLTYPLYLIHEIPGWVLIHYLAPVLNAYVTVALVVLVMLVAAYLVHRFVETPLGPRLRRSVERDLGRAMAQQDVPRPREETARRASPAPLRRPPVAGPRAVRADGGRHSRLGTPPAQRRRHAQRILPAEHASSPVRPRS
jgi:peptidoglycan/LPS O-acetylase OafA/YrhL